MPIWADNRNEVGPVTVWTAILGVDILENCANFSVSYSVSPLPVVMNQKTTFTAIVKGNSGAVNYEWNFSESAKVDCSTASCTWTFTTTSIAQVSLLVTEQQTGGCYRGATAFVVPAA